MYLIFLPLFLFIGCAQSQTKYVAYDGRTQGTTFHIIYSTVRDENFSSQVDSILKVVDHNFSLWDTTSILSRINANRYNEKLPPVFIRLFNLSKEIYEHSHGAFDPSVGPLVDFWGFGPQKNGPIDTQLLRSVKEKIGFNYVKIEEGRLIKQKADIRLNFNAIAQGFAVDLIVEYFDSLNIKNYMIEIGGEVRVKGVNNKGQHWRIGIDKPAEDNVQSGGNIEAIISLPGGSVSTSGNYRNYYVENGVKYSHTINPRTGYPAKNNLLSASVFSPSCGIADAYATAMMVLGTDEAIKLAKTMKLNIYLIYNDSMGRYKTYISPEITREIIAK